MAALRELGHKTELRTFSTKGDRVQDRPLYQVGGKGLFVREIEQALLDGSADIAVHSLKDMPVAQPDGLEIAAVLPRGDSGDLLVLNHTNAPQRHNNSEPLTAKEFAALNLPIIASGSLRRSYLLRSVTPDLEVMPLRGNIGTRLNKQRNGDFPAQIMAAAAIARMGEDLLGDDLIAIRLDPTWFVPAPAQGTIACEIATHARPDVLQALAEINHDLTARSIAVERGVLAALGGDCTLPIGIHATHQRCWAVSFAGGIEKRCEMEWGTQEPSKMVTELFKRLS